MRYISLADFCFIFYESKVSYTGDGMVKNVFVGELSKSLLNYGTLSIFIYTRKLKRKEKNIYNRYLLRNFDACQKNPSHHRQRFKNKVYP